MEVPRQRRSFHLHVTLADTLQRRHVLRVGTEYRLVVGDGVSEVTQRQLDTADPSIQPFMSMHLTAIRTYRLLIFR